MIFHKRRDTPQLDLLLNNIKVELVSNFRFLGIILDSPLAWKYHTKMIANKIYKNNWYFRQVKKYFPERIFFNNIQITNCATFKLWSPIMESKFERHNYFFFRRKPYD